MSDKATVVLDTNSLLNLATPVVDTRKESPSGEDPLMAVLESYDCHVPSSVMGEITTATDSNDLLSSAAELVLKASHNLTVHGVGKQVEGSLDYGLDEGESHAIWLANDLDADMFVTDEVNNENILMIMMVIEDRNTIFPTSHVLCKLAAENVLDEEYVDHALSYYVETKDWDKTFIDRLRTKYL